MDDLLSNPEVGNCFEAKAPEQVASAARWIAARARAPYSLSPFLQRGAALRSSAGPAPRPRLCFLMAHQSSSSRGRVAVVAAKRTPIGKYMGSFADLSAADLGVAAAEAALSAGGVAPELVGEVYLGNGRQAGGGPNVARQISVRAGVPETTCATTINMACGSGLKTIVLGADAIRRGDVEVALVGGTESMSGLPFLLPQMRRGYRLGHAPLVDAMYKDGFVCPLADMVMGETAEGLAQDLGITRDEQDSFAVASQCKAGAAIEANRFADELAPVTVSQRKGDIIVEADEHVRPDADMAKMAKLPAVFGENFEGEGTVSPGNASGITDGACAIVLASEAACEQNGWTPLAFVGESAQSGVDPRRMGLGPVPACVVKPRRPPRVERRVGGRPECRARVQRQARARDVASRAPGSTL